MKLPSHLKKLYRHWNIHTKTPGTKIPIQKLIQDKGLSKDLLWFIKERITIWDKKTQGLSAPYTKDPILNTYRFCNIFREFDKQTIEFHTILNPIRGDFPLWLLNMFYFRMVAQTETIRTVGLLSFDTQENKSFYKKLMDSPRPRFGTPYVFPISTIMRSKTPTRELFIAHYLPKIIPVIAREIITWNKKSVYDGVKVITKLFRYNLNFLWTEVLIDVAYQYPEYINLFDQFPIGPGSLPTLRRINPKQDPSILVKDLVLLQINTGVTYNNEQLFLSAENWEGIGCEFRKYTNLKQGKGRKRIYKNSILHIHTPHR